MNKFNILKYQFLHKLINLESKFKSSYRVSTVTRLYLLAGSPVISLNSNWKLYLWNFNLNLLKNYHIDYKSDEEPELHL